MLPAYAQSIGLTATDVGLVVAVPSFASAIGEALSMPKAEQKKRMKALRSEVLELDVHRWADDFLSALEHG